MLLQVAKRFLQYLKQIDKIYNYMERQLYKSQRNKELIQLLDLEKVTGLLQHLAQGQ